MTSNDIEYLTAIGLFAVFVLVISTILAIFAGPKDKRGSCVKKAGVGMIGKTTGQGRRCALCGADEFRVDGYCSVECRDLHAVEVERDKLRSAIAVHRARTLLGGVGSSADSALWKVLT